ncbi:MAG: aminomethyl-transferring glycine dehydrogenase subunit GcvPA [Muribaculaceae bacterium]|nr:aminomethyl-transferring glycine dehydrogenase subunit GcvPA [Muribaculaceae bacterium]
MYQHRYFPHTGEDITAMLERIGAKSADEMFADIPAHLRLSSNGYDLPEEMSEPEVRDYFEGLRDQNKSLVCFAGGGFYDHYSPAVIPYLTSRSEFLTAYTPYQPEISQGTLQYIFEYQSMMAELTGLDVTNASLYDGATATAEAVLMCVAASRKKNRVLVSSTMAPAVLEVVKTYARYHKIDIDLIAEKDGVTDFEDLKRLLAKGDVAGVIVSAINYYGIVEDYTGWSEVIKESKALFAINTHAIALGVLRSPAEWGADIAVGEAQSLGFPLNYGGPGLGYMCVTKALMRKMPGRIVGATTDEKGQRVFVLTLQAREQHIRREKATSNICSNQGIMTLYAAIYLALMGAEGLKRVNVQSSDAAHYAASQIENLTKAKLLFPDKPYLNEFVLHTPHVDAIIAKGVHEGVLAGIKIGDDRLLLAFTELRTKAQIDKLVQIIKSAENE